MCFSLDFYHTSPLRFFHSRQFSVWILFSFFSVASLLASILLGHMRVDHEADPNIELIKRIQKGEPSLIECFDVFVSRTQLYILATGGHCFVGPLLVFILSSSFEMRQGVIGYAGSPYKQIWSPFSFRGRACSLVRRWLCCNKYASCHRHLVGQCRPATKPLGSLTDWNFMACTLLWPS